MRKEKKISEVRKMCWDFFKRDEYKKRKIYKIESKSNKNGKYLLTEILKKNRKDLYNMDILSWLYRTIDVKIYILKDGEFIKSFILMTRLNFDPKGQHINPYEIEYMYNFYPEEENYYIYLLVHIKEKEEITYITKKKEEIKLFRLLGFRNRGETMEGKVMMFP